MAQTPPGAFPPPQCPQIESREANRVEGQLRRGALRAEWNIGKKLAEEADRHTKLVTDPMTIQYLNRIEQNLVAKAGLSGCFTVKIAEDVSANAYSLPGGFLYVTTRLIMMANSESELAAALAHESAHVQARHFTRLSQRRRLWGTVILAGGPAGYLARRYAGPLMTLKLLRNSEFDADRRAEQYLGAAGYDPAGISRLLQSSFQDEDSAPTFFERLFDSHPLTTTRIKRLKKMAGNSYREPGNDLEHKSEFRSIQTRISLLMGISLFGNADQLASCADVQSRKRDSHSCPSLCQDADLGTTSPMR